jgi:hypothetical protein
MASELKREADATSSSADDIFIDEGSQRRAEGLPSCTTNAGPAIEAPAAGGLTSLISSFFAAAPSSQAQTEIDAWKKRLKEEYSVLVTYMKALKADDALWFSCKEVTHDDSGAPIPDGHRGEQWRGEAWWYHENMRYKFQMIIQLPVGYPAVPPEIILPQLLGKTPKMYRCVHRLYAPSFTNVILTV